MDIYLTNLETSDRLQFPMLPTEVNIKIAQQFATYSILRIGEVRVPSGTQADSFSWSGILPGPPRRNDPYIHAWQDPKAIYNWLNALRVKNDRPVKARLLITETPVNSDVYLTSLTATPTGGYGDINYSLTLVQAREILVRKSSETAVVTTLKDSPPAESTERTEPPAPKTYTVVKGDCLWKIAQKFYGKGSDYPKIQAANTAVISKHGKDPTIIWPGDVLTIP